jgi:tetratricopeptide (TPR) repeat protein
VSPREDARAHARAGRDAQKEGRPGEARYRFELALHALTLPEEGPMAADLLRWVAWTHATEGDPHAALDCLDAAEAVAAAHADDFSLASVLNTRAGTLFGMGELDQAEALFSRVRRLAVKVGDQKLVAIADQNLGSVSSIRGDLEMALGRFRSSLANFEALG